jgi:hypothetical protein
MRAFLLLTSAFFIACTGTVPSRYEIRDLRVISVVAEPPEVAPGDTVQLTAYFEDPEVDASGIAASMRQCPDTGTQTRDITCVGTASELTLASEPTVPAFAVPNVFSAQFTYTESATALTDVPPSATAYGYYDQILFHGQDAHGGIDASKRVVVTAAGTPKNKNPSLQGFAVIESEGQAQDLFAMQRGGSYTLQPIYDPSSLESYTVKDYTGHVLSFVEEASFVWSCAQSCTIDRDTSYGDQTVTLSLPLDWNFGDSLLVNVVMRDGRGGEVPFVREFRVLPHAD